MSRIQDQQVSEALASPSAAVVLSTELICSAAGVPVHALPALTRLNLHVRDRSFPKIASIDNLSLSACISLESLNLSYHWLTHAPRLSHFAGTLRELNFAENRLADINEEICQLARLQLLNLSGNRIRRIPPGMRAMRSLVSLRLSRNQLDTLQDVRHLAGLSQLLKLRIDANPISSQSQDNGDTREFVLSTLQQLQALDGQVVDIQERRQQHLPHSDRDNFAIGGVISTPSSDTGVSVKIDNEAKSPNETSTFFTPMASRSNYGVAQQRSSGSGSGSGGTANAYGSDGNILRNLALSPVASANDLSYEQADAPAVPTRRNAHTPFMDDARSQVRNGLATEVGKQGQSFHSSSNISTSTSSTNDPTSRRAVLDLSQRVEHLTSRLVQVEAEKSALLQNRQHALVHDFRKVSDVSVMQSLHNFSNVNLQKDESFNTSARVGNSISMSQLLSHVGNDEEEEEVAGTNSWPTAFGSPKGSISTRAHVYAYANSITPSPSYNSDQDLELKGQPEYDLKTEITKLSKLQAAMLTMETTLAQERKQRLLLEQQQIEYINQQQLIDQEQEHLREVSRVHETENARAQGAIAEKCDLAMQERDSAVTAMQKMQLELTDAQENSRKQLKNMQELHVEALARLDRRWNSEVEELVEKLKLAHNAVEVANTSQGALQAKLIHVESSLAVVTASNKATDSENTTLAATLASAQLRCKELEEQVGVLSKEKSHWVHLQAQEAQWKEQRKLAENAAHVAVQEAAVAETRLQDLRRSCLEQQHALSKSAEAWKSAQENAVAAETRRVVAEKDLRELHSQIESATNASNKLEKSTREARDLHIECSRELHVLQAKWHEVQNQVLDEENKLKRVSVEGSKKLCELQLEFDTSIAEHRRREQACSAMDKQVSEAREEIERKTRESTSVLDKLQKDADLATEAVRQARAEQRGIQREISQFNKKKQQLQSEITEMEDLLTSERGHRRTNEEEFKRHIEQLQRLLTDTELRWRNLKEEVRVLETAAADARVVCEQQRRAHTEAERTHRRRIQEVEDILFAKKEEAQFASRAVKSSNSALETSQFELEQVTHDLRSAERQLTTARSALTEQSTTLDDLCATIRTTQGQLALASTQLEAVKQTRENEQARVNVIKSQLVADSKTLDDLTKKIHSTRLADIGASEVLKALEKDIKELTDTRDSARQSHEDIQARLENDRRNALELRTRRITLENESKRLENELIFTKDRIADAVARRQSSETELERTRDAFSLAQHELCGIQKQVLEARRVYDDIAASTTNSKNERDRCSTEMESTSMRLSQENNTLRELQTEKREILLSLRSLREDLRLLQGHHSSAVSTLDLSLSQTKLAEASKQTLNDDVSLLRDTIRTEQVRLNTTIEAQAQAETVARNLKAEISSLTVSLENVRVNIRNEEHVLNERRRSLQDATSQLLQTERDLKVSLQSAHQEREALLNEIGRLGAARQAAERRIPTTTKIVGNDSLKDDALGGKQPQELPIEVEVEAPVRIAANMQRSFSRRGADNSSHASTIAKTIVSPKKVPTAFARATATATATATAFVANESTNFASGTNQAHSNTKTYGTPLNRFSAVSWDAQNLDPNSNLLRSHSNIVNEKNVDGFVVKGEVGAGGNSGTIDGNNGGVEVEQEEEEDEDDLATSAERLRRQSLAVFNEAGILWNEAESIL